MNRCQSLLIFTSIVLASVLVGCDSDDDMSPRVACDEDFAPTGDARFQSWNIVDPRPAGSSGYSSVYGITIHVQRGQADGRLLLTVDSDPDALTDEGHRLFSGATCVAECSVDPHVFECDLQSDGDGDPQPLTATLTGEGEGGGAGGRYGLRGTCGIDGYVATFVAVEVP